MQKYADTGLNLDFYPRLYTESDSQLIYDMLEKEVAWLKPITSGRRSNQIYGDDGLVYEVKFSGYRGNAKALPPGPGATTRRKAQPWTPLLAQIRDDIAAITGAKYTICVVQRYPNGSVGINPHKDKEMLAGTTIAGLSFGSTRTLVMARGEKALRLDLGPGSMYVLNPPTNDYWSHAIEKSTETRPRISLTFRNYVNA